MDAVLPEQMMRWQEHLNCSESKPRGLRVYAENQVFARQEFLLVCDSAQAISMQHHLPNSSALSLSVIRVSFLFVLWLWGLSPDNDTE